MRSELVRWRDEPVAEGSQPVRHGELCPA
jgi:hypothetical protein